MNASNSRARLDAQAARKIAVQALDAARIAARVSGQRGRQQRFEAIGDAGKRGVHDDRAQARRRCARAVTPAMLCQLPADDTLVPPNLRTTQA
jgi:hypothetical protein